MGITPFALLLAQINVDEATPGLQKIEGRLYALEEEVRRSIIECDRR
jgi:hypothetical protein